jgi:hypothetical protein
LFWSQGGEQQPASFCVQGSWDFYLLVHNFGLFFAPHLAENLVLRFRFDQNVFIPFQVNTTSSTKYFIRPNVLV